MVYSYKKLLGEFISVVSRYKNQLCLRARNNNWTLKWKICIPWNSTKTNECVELNLINVPDLYAENHNIFLGEVEA